MLQAARSLSVLAAFLAALCPPRDAAAMGASAEPPPPVPPISRARPFDRSEATAFFDRYMAAQMSSNHIAGAVVAVVKGGDIVLAKGYGHADVVRHLPVDPERTVFILGSLSKLFTWTAVMQLVERGKLDLGADVNNYLDFRIPATFSQPITLRHLMSHNAGFEDNTFGQMAATPAEAIPLGQWLRTHVPTRVRPPGQLAAYANYGTALAGYIVERVSGVSYDEYVEKNIFEPLKMTHSSSRQPLPAAMAADLSQGYLFAGGEYRPRPDLNVVPNVGPAAAVCTTAADAARFMIAHLEAGRCGEASILHPATVQLMHSQSFTSDQRVNGMAHGFWELDMNGEEIIGHAGSHFIFNSLLMLFPRQRLGVFVATNSRGGDAILGLGFTAFEQAFVDHFFPRSPPSVSSPPDFARRAGRFGGTYHLATGRSETTPTKLQTMLMAVAVRGDKDGLTVPGLGNQRFVEVEPLVFRRVGAAGVLVFREDSQGEIREAFLAAVPLTALIKNRWFEGPVFNLLLLGACVVLFLNTLAWLFVARLRRKRVSAHPPTRFDRTAKLVAGLAAGSSLLVVTGAFASLFNIYGVYVGNLPLATPLPFLSIAVAALAVAMLACTIVAWARRRWSVWRRVHYTLVTLSCIGFVWFMWLWNILGKRF